jgi:hypothetical protein
MGNDSNSETLGEKEQMVSRLISLVATFEAFSTLTGFPSMVYMSFGEAMSQYKLNTFLDALKSNDISKSSYKESMKPFQTLTSSPDGLENNMVKEVFGDANSLYKAFKDQYITTDLPPLGPAKEVPHAYAVKMRTICAQLYYNLHSYTIAEAGSRMINRSDLTPMQYSNVLNDCTALVDIITKNVAFDPTNTHETYLEDVFNVVKDEQFNTVIKDPIKQQFFMWTFTPFFIYRYILNFLPNAVYTPADKGVRSMSVRRIAIMCVYMFNLYMIYGLYRVCAKHEPSGEATTVLRMIMDSHVVWAFNQEAMAVNKEMDLTQFHKQTSNSFNKSRKIHQTNREIELARNNLNTVIGNEQQVRKDLKKTVTIKWVWFAFLIMYLVGCVSMVVVGFIASGESNAAAAMRTLLPVIVKAMYINSGIYLVALFITWLVQTSRKM